MRDFEKTTSTRYTILYTMATDNSNEEESSSVVETESSGTADSATSNEENPVESQGNFETGSENTETLYLTITQNEIGVTDVSIQLVVGEGKDKAAAQETANEVAEQLKTQLQNENANWDAISTATENPPEVLKQVIAAAEDYLGQKVDGVAAIEIPKSTPIVDAPQKQKELPYFLLIGLIGVVLGAALLKLAEKLLSPKNPPVIKNVAPEKIEVTSVSKAVEPEHTQMEVKPESRQIPSISALHNIGARPGQQDSFGFEPIPGGMIAVVADGMGGLADGDKVSQLIVRSMMTEVKNLSRGNNQYCLYELASRANRAVLSMLGPNKIYQCGSTLISVIVQDNWMQWLSIGDSRIYLYRAGRLMQLNREHTLKYEMLVDVANSRRSVAEVRQNPKGKGLTSFIGMGELKYVDGSPHPVQVQPGDRVLLMSDGVFNTLPEAEIESILAQEPEAPKATALMEQRVLEHKSPKQDNFTAILLNI